MTKKTTNKKRTRKVKDDQPVDAMQPVLGALEQDGEDDEPAPKTLSTAMRKYRSGYEPTIAYSGRVSLNKGDDVATILAGKSPADVLGLAERLLGLDAGELVARYAKLNPGQQRMNGGNRIRAAIKRGDVTLEQLRAA